MAIYLKFDTIKGNVEADGHDGWIDCLSMSWGVGRGVSAGVGTGQDREAAPPSISEVVITKLMDQATPYLFTESCVGKSKKAEIHLVKTDAGKLESYMEYKLEDVLISSYSVSAGTDRPTEQVALSFTKIEMKYIPWKKDHTKDSPIPAGYDMSKGKKT